MFLSSLCEIALYSPFLYLSATSSTSSGRINWVTLLIGLLGGLAMFLYGLDKMSESLKTAAGDRLRVVLKRLTQNRWSGLLTGVVATGVTQSSSITTVLLVGFVSAGLLTVQQSVAVVMGSNVGTTVTGQLAAFHLAQYTLLFVAIGWLGTVKAPTQALRQWSQSLLGLGLLFVGMELMSQSMKPLQSAPAFIAWMGQMRYAWVGLLSGGPMRQRRRLHQWPMCGVYLHTQHRMLSQQWLCTWSDLRQWELSGIWLHRWGIPLRRDPTRAVY